MRAVAVDCSISLKANWIVDFLMKSFRPDHCTHKQSLDGLSLKQGGKTFSLGTCFKLNQWVRSNRERVGLVFRRPGVTLVNLDSSINRITEIHVCPFGLDLALITSCDSHVLTRLPTVSARLGNLRPTAWIALQILESGNSLPKV